MTKRVKGESCTLSTYLARRKLEGKKLFDEGSAVLRYVELSRLPEEYLKLAWMEFREQHTEGQRKARIQKDWPATFLNCLKANWYKYWYIDKGTGDYQLSSIGMQAKIVADNKRKAKQQ